MVYGLPTSQFSSQVKETIQCTKKAATKMSQVLLFSILFYSLAVYCTPFPSFYNVLVSTETIMSICIQHKKGMI